MKLHALLCCILILACASAPTRAASSTAPRARFQLRMPNQVSGSIQKGEFEMVLANQSDRALWVNGRMSVADPGTVPGATEVSLEIAGPLGNAFFACFLKTSDATEKDYVILRPGELWVRKASLMCFDGMDAPGKYTARARYHDRNPTLPPAPAGTQHLSEELVAAPVQFEVVKK
jgi:hypothetical protein